MAIRLNPDGSITVGMIEEERQPEVVADVPFEEVKAEKPKRATKPKTKSTKKKAE